MTREPHARIFVKMNGVLDWPLVFLGLGCLLGLAGTVFPAFPGTPVILASAVGYAWWTDFEVFGLWTLLVLFLLTLGGVGSQFVITALGARGLGATRWGSAGAILGMMVGLILPLPFPLGPLVGAFLGAVLLEQVGRKRREAQSDSSAPPREEQEGRRSKQSSPWLGGLGAALGAVFSLLLEFLFGFAMIAVVLFGLL